MSFTFHNVLAQYARAFKRGWVFALSLGMMLSAQAMPLAGVVITNQAQITYVDSVSGQTSQLNSNVVEIQVQQVSAFTLISPQSRVVVPGGTSNLPHQVRNLGNGAEAFNLGAVLGTGALNVVSLNVYADVNGDAIPDNFIPITTTPVLAPGGVFNFVVAATVAATALATDSRVINVSASGTATATPAPTQNNLDTLTISNQAILVLTKVFDVQSGPSPNTNGGANITATLTLTNTGTVAATNVTLNDLIGGISTAPAFDTTGMAYVAGSATWNGMALNDAGVANPAGVTYTATTLGVATTLNAAFASLAPGLSAKLTFKFSVLPGVAVGTLRTNNIATSTYLDGLVQQTVNSNVATYNVTAMISLPDLTLTKTHVGTFTVGFPGTHNLLVSNIGVTQTTSAITVIDTLPAGLVYSASGTGGNGWVCNAVLQVVTCLTNAVVMPGTSAPILPITVIPNAVAAAASPVTNVAAVSGGGEPAPNGGNNGATDITIVGLPATVSGHVWLDANHDKMFNPTEQGLAGWQAELLDATGKVIMSALSLSTGVYTLGPVVPGLGYQLRFRDPSTNVAYSSPVIGDGTAVPVGSVVPANAKVVNGVITALDLTPGMNAVDLDMPLDPSGVVYDAVTRQPVSGATVTLVCPTCAPAFNPAVHLFGGAANVSQNVGSTGYYQFLLLGGSPAGNYQLQVVAPAGYLSPSTLIPVQPMALTPPIGVGNYPVQAQVGPPPAGSPTTYYLSFNIVAGIQNIVNNHIPLDPKVVAGSGFLISKTASRTTVEVGDFIDYTVMIKNTTLVVLPNSIVKDSLPRGLTYQLGSARLNGVPMADPLGGVGPQLTFPIGTLGSNTSMTLTYRVAVGVTATLGTGINSAQASSGAAMSNIARAKVQIVQGVLSDKGYILGTVYMDCNRNHIQEIDEPGIPGVRLFLENGTNATTDTDGKFSFYGVDPRTHHLKLDQITLPLGATLETLANRHAGVAGGRFVDLKNGELHRADFASPSCSEAVMNEVNMRHRKDTVTETERMLNYRLNPNAAIIAPGDPRVLPASGELVKNVPSTTTPVESYQPLSQNTGLSGGNSALPNAPVAPAVSVDLDGLMPDLNNTLDFIDLKDKDVLPMAQTVVRIKGLMGSTFRLSVNDDEVADSRVAKKSTLVDRQLEAWEYLGVSLKPGYNVLTLKQFDPFGNERAKRSITVLAPDQLAKIKVDAPATVEANGRTLVHVNVQLMDVKNVPVTSRTYLTLEATQGRWQVKDLDAKEPGVQVAMENGKAEFDLLPPTQPGQETLRIMSGVLKAEHAIAYLPELRPLVAAGIIEGALSMHSLNASRLTPVTAQDSFDQEIQHMSRGNATGRVAARTAMFLKGKVKGEYLLTLAYDSDKNVKDRLFRDIQPDEFYPVYGDSSNKGFDAQSTSRLYVRVDQGKSYLMYGDFTTQNVIPARALSQYSRSLTGVKEHYEIGKVMVNAFASRDTMRQMVQEIPADGTSGPFQLTNNGALINSEKVEILTRDRNQPAVVLRTEPQLRFTDYEIEQFTGRLLFKGPVASLDVNLNPRYVRITYELDQGGTGFWVGGVDGQVKLSDTVEVGGMVVRDANPMQSVSVMGANATLKLAEKTIMVGELAHSNTLLGVGNAQRLELREEHKDFQGRIYSGRSDPTFDNPSSMLNKGRVEAGAKATYRVNPSTSLTGEVVSTGDQLTGAKRDGVLVKVEKTLNDIMRLEVGMRDTTDSPNTAGVAPTQVTSARVKLISQVPSIKGLSVNGEYEQDVKDSGKKVAALGGEYQMMNRGKLYARHEFLSSLSSPFALNPTQRSNSTVFGIDTDYTPNTHLFSEYRARGVMDGRQAEAAVGVRNKWQIAEGLRINGGVERVTSLAGGAGRNSQAYTGAIEYTRNPLWKGSGRLEYRTSDTSDGWLNSVDIARRLTDSWTVIGKQVFSENTTKGVTAGSRILHRMQGGLAWRDMIEHDWNFLSKFEHRRESDTTSASPTKRVMEILSMHVNYQSDSDWQASGHYAAKWLTDESAGLSSHSNAHLASGRLMWDITERWDAGVLGSVMGDRGFRALRYGVGAETGYLLQENLWLSVGYNFFGFKDTDAIGQNATDRGIFVRLRFKFDEDLFTGIANRFEETGRRCKP
jgi:uncharacterized repeat protein (TIGR01451 family)